MQQCGRWGLRLTARAPIDAAVASTPVASAAGHGGAVVKRTKKKPRTLRAVGGAASAVAAAGPPAPGPKTGELVELSAAISDEQKIAERRELIDRHRGQRSEQTARHARETADLVARHEDEETALEKAQARDVAAQWRRHGRGAGEEPSGFMLRQLDGVVGYVGEGKTPA